MLLQRIMCSVKGKKNVIGIKRTLLFVRTYQFSKTTRDFTLLKLKLSLHFCHYYNITYYNIEYLIS